MESGVFICIIATFFEMSLISFFAYVKIFILFLCIFTTLSAQQNSRGIAVLLLSGSVSDSLFSPCNGVALRQLLYCLRGFFHQRRSMYSLPSSV